MSESKLDTALFESNKVFSISDLLERTLLPILNGYRILFFDQLWTVTKDTPTSSDTALHR